MFKKSTFLRSQAGFSKNYDNFKIVFIFKLLCLKKRYLDYFRRDFGANLFIYHLFAVHKNLQTGIGLRFNLAGLRRDTGGKLALSGNNLGWLSKRCTTGDEMKISIQSFAVVIWQV